MQPVSGIRLFGIRLGVVLLALYWCVIFTGTHLPKIPAAVPRMNDKVMHFTAFFMLATLLCYCTNSTRLLRRFGTIVVACISYAILDELTQSLVRGRTPDVHDFFADSLGTLLAVGLYFTARVAWGRRQDTTSGEQPSAILS
ncbi:MAG: VanZ family protein [Rhodopirellula sp. JB044]|uniref:VanZ family protein n=1 Tax=Rhodopirellula sp. JB044 TaxID=3342844 RepID=UPI00370C1C9A